MFTKSHLQQDILLKELQPIRIISTSIIIFGTGTDIMWGYMTKKKTDWSNVINSSLNNKKGSVTIHVVGQVVITKCMHHFDTNITSMN